MGTRAALLRSLAGLLVACLCGTAVAQQTTMDGVAVISEGPSVMLRWSLHDDAYLPGSFTLTRTDDDGTEHVITVASPRPFEESGLSAERYEAALAVFGQPVPEDEQVWDDEDEGEDEGEGFDEDDPVSLALVRAFFELELAADPDLAAALGLLYRDDDVEVGRFYRYEVVGADGSVIGSAGIVAGSTPPLAPPTGLRVTPTGDAIELSWDRGDETDLVFGYRVTVSVDGGDPLDLSPVWLAPPAPESDDGRGAVVEAPYWFRDEGRLAGEVAAYQVVGRDLFGRVTPPSLAAVIVVPDPVPLPQPLVIDGSSGDHTITLAWALEPDDRVSAVGVLRTRDIDAEPTLVSPLLAPDATTWTDVGLVAGADYHYAVAAFDAAGRASVSPIWTQRAINPRGPDGPSELVIEPTPTALLLSWTASPQVDVGRYQVFAGRPGTPFETWTLLGETVLTRFSAPVPANTMFDVAFRVRAVNTSDVVGGVSEAVAARPLDETPPSAPLWADVTGVEDAIELVWLRDLDPDVAYVRLLRAAGDDELAVLVADLPPEVTRYRDEAVVPGATYRYALAAVDEYGNTSQRSQERSASAWSLAAPTDVVELTAEVVDGGVRLGWQRGPDTGTTWLVSRKLAGQWVEVSDLLREPSFLDARGTAGDEYLVVTVGTNGQLSAGVSVVAEAGEGD